MNSSTEDLILSNHNCALFYAKTQAADAGLGETEVLTEAVARGSNQDLL